MVLVKSTAMESAKLIITGAKIVFKISDILKIHLLSPHKEKSSVVQEFIWKALVKIINGRRII